MEQLGVVSPASSPSGSPLLGLDPKHTLAIMSEARSLRRAMGAFEAVLRREVLAARCRRTGELNAENDDLPGWFLDSP